VTVDNPNGGDPVGTCVDTSQVPAPGGTPEGCDAGNDPTTCVPGGAPDCSPTANATQCLTGSGSNSDSANPSITSFKVYPHGDHSAEAVALRRTVDFLINATDDVNVTSLKLMDGDTVLGESHYRVKDNVRTFVVSTTNMTEGLHDFKAVARDGTGKEGSQTKTLRVDNTPPAIPTVTFGASPTGQAGWYLDPVQVALSDAGDSQSPVTLSYSLNNGTAQAYTGAFTLNGAGITNLTAMARDDAGNQANASRTVKLDTSDPVIVFLARPVSLPANSTATIRFQVASGSPPLAVHLLVDGVSHTAAHEAGSNVYEVLLPLLKSDAGKTLAYQVQMRNEAGRSASSETIRLAVTAASSGSPQGSPGADDDGDGLTNAQEAAIGSDPNDINSPHFQADTPKVELLANGTMKVTWTAPLKARIDRFLVFRFSDPVKVAEVPFVAGKSTYTAYDAAYPGGTHTYRVQSKLVTDPLLTFSAAKASPSSLPITASSSSAVAAPGTTDAWREPWFYIGTALLVGILVVMASGIARRRRAVA
jgi:hypothetical protein